MKNTLLLFLLSAGLITSAQNVGAESLQLYNKLDTLITRRFYFTARDLYNSQSFKLSDFHKLRIGAALENAFNHPAVSNQKIELLFRSYPNQLSDSARYDLLQIRQNNHSKLYEYRQAYEAINDILTRHSRLLKASDIDDFKNTRKIWMVLSDQPKQLISIKGNTDMKMKKDKAGLSNLRVTNDSVTVPFIFDTGANFSTVTETTAKRLKMIIFDSLIDVGSITGEKIKARMAICPEFNMGNINVKNAVFIVFPDEALTISQIDYVINGILGFPVIEAFKEVQITKSGDFIVPEIRTKSSEQNMAIHFLNPVINIDGEPYSFDTGADETMLYDVYYKKHKKEIDSNYKEEDLSFGGAGGITTKRGFLIDFKHTINGKSLSLDSVMVFKENIKEEENFFFGNIGQDFIKQFDKMTLNFEDMFIRFE